MALAIFDLDNTLIAGDSDHAWGEFLVERGIVDAESYRVANDKFYQDYLKGSLDIHEYLSFALRPLAKHPIAQLYAWRDDFFESKIKPIILPKGRALIASHLEQNDQLLIITATNRFVTEPIASALGVRHLIATEPEQLEEGFTGRVAGTPSFKDGKITRLNEWLAQQGLGPEALRGAFFYSDSHNDLPLLKLVDNPIAVDPDEKLRHYCEQNQWPVQSLR